jgi:class 3 adenylate cyclase/tetratricopeptide (TPR) repeat protein
MVFCDLVDSTALAAAMDPEDLHDLMTAYQRDSAKCIEEAGGFVARFAGDGLLAYFGYPVALEDAPQRAIHAALNMRMVSQRLALPEGRFLAVRVGVASGLVVIGELTSQNAREHAVSGATPNLAARLQSLARPGTVLVSDATKRLADGVFAFASVSPVHPKGLSSPIPAWEVVGPRASISRYEARRAIGVNPLVGREDELETILRAWRETRGGEGRVVGIVGDPGIGKSRLLEEVRRRVDGPGAFRWLEGGGVSHHDNTPFHVAAQLSPDLARIASAGDRDRPATDPLKTGAVAQVEDRRRRLLQMAEVIRRVAAQLPTVLVVEDLHWVDPSSMELLDLLVELSRTIPLLLLYTSRRDFSDRWPADVRCRVVRLAGLSPQASAKLAQIAAGGPLYSQQIETVVTQSGGVPLYIEELARLLIDKSGCQDQESLPTTLSDLLAARLEALGPAKRAAQIASVLGSEFMPDLFEALADLSGDRAEPVLAELEAGSIIVRRPNGSCAFRHTMIAAAAYDALLKRERRALHRRAAQIITERHPALAELQPQALARHWTLAGEVDRALASWENAGLSAAQRRALMEAENAYRQALALIERAPVKGQYDREELRIRAAFNCVLQITQGYSSAEAACSSERVSELAARIGDTDALVREERVKWRSVFTAGDYAQAAAILGNVMKLTEGHREDTWRLTLSLRAGIHNGFYTGNLTRAESDFLAWATLDDGSHRGDGDDVVSMGIAGLIALSAGRRRVGEGRIASAFAIAHGQGGAYDLAMALHCEAGFHHRARDPPRQAEAAARLAEIASENRFNYVSLLATAWLAIADLEAGRPGHAFERAVAAVAGFERMGARVAMMFYLGVLATAQWRNGDTDAALATFAKALAVNDQEHAFRPETLLARAAMLQELGAIDQAERDFSEALRVSHDMGAVLYQFRALNQLAAARLAAGDDVAARRMLGSARAFASADFPLADLSDLEALGGALAICEPNQNGAAAPKA